MSPFAIAAIALGLAALVGAAAWLLVRYLTLD